MDNDDKGFTLIEVMISLFVFTIGILAVASMQVVARNQLSSTKQNLNNSVSAIAFMEQVIGLDYDDPRLADRDDGYDPDNPDHGPELLESSRASIEWEVDDDFPAPRSKRITVTIRRTDPGGLERRMRYEYVKCLDFF